MAAPDCGMKYLSRESAYGKLEALAEGARLAASLYGLLRLAESWRLLHLPSGGDRPGGFELPGFDARTAHRAG